MKRENVIEKSKRPFKIIKNAYLWVIIGVIGFIFGIGLFTFNAQYSEEFTGGVSLTVENQVTSTVADQIKTALTEKGYKDVQVSLNTQEEGTVVKIHTSIMNDEKVIELSQDIKNYLLTANVITSQDEILSQSITGPSVGAYMQKTAFRALVVGLFFIIIYMFISFYSVRNYISPGTLAVITIGTMLFDISIPSWAYGIRMAINSTIQVDTVFIIAILTCMGYSINDTIIIFDRIRENLVKSKKLDKVVYGEIFEDSLWQTMRRSIATSVSTLLVIIFMFLFGAGMIQTFAFAVGIGVIAGSYSSIFIAAPLAYIITGKYKKEKNRI